MSRIAISAVRRRELQEATLQVLLEQGYHAITTDRIASQAGISRGIVHHYFRSKNELLEFTTRYYLRLYAEGAREHLKRARTPSERLWGLIEANFSPAIFTQQYAYSDLTIWDERPHFKSVKRVYDVMSRRTRTNISYALRSLVEEEDRRMIADTIWNLIEGCWILNASEPDMTRLVAKSILVRYLRDRVPRFDMSVVKLDS
jgi:TetR/AcrR family transcriptional repressor of bet genes